MRKHKRDNHNLIPTGRRAHGIFTHVAPTPSAIRSALSRKRLYQHSRARYEDDVAEATRQRDAD